MPLVDRVAVLEAKMDAQMAENAVLRSRVASLEANLGVHGGFSPDSQAAEPQRGARRGSSGILPAPRRRRVASPRPDTLPECFYAGNDCMSSCEQLAVFSARRTAKKSPKWILLCIPCCNYLEGEGKVEDVSGNLEIE